MKKVINFLKGSPKTSITAVITLLLTTALHMGYIDMKTFVELAGLAGTLGFAVSKDANVTGTGI